MFFFFADSVQSCVTVLMVDGWCPILSQCSSCGKCPILVTAPELQEDWIGTRVVSYCSLGLLLSSSIWCHKSDPGHGTKIARGLVRYKG